MLQGLVRAALILGVIALGGLLPTPAQAAPAQIDSYAQPSIYPRSPDYELTVNGRKIDVVDYPGYDYAHFSMGAGEATIAVRKLNNTNIGAYSISPRKLGLSGSVSGSTMTFTIPRDEYLIVKLDGRPDLVIAADPAETDKPASSGTGIYNVVSRGADPTGAAMSTAAVQGAVDAANAAGQGTVYVPAGVYKVGNVVLKSNVSLYLAAGAVFRFTGNPADYTHNWHKDSQNRDITWWISTAFGSSNIRVYGRGTLDGNGQQAATQYNFAANILVPIATTDFRFDGLIVRESGAWAIVTARSRDLGFTNVKIFNRFDMGENDGIDVNESQDVTVRHGIGISLDDPWTTKTWRADTDIAKPWPGSPQVVDNVLFDDLISWTRCYGFKVGQGALQPQSRVTFRNGVVYDAAIGIGIHHRYGSALVTGVTFEAIDIEKISVKLVDDRTWLRFIIEDRGLGAGPVRGVTVKNITVRDRGTTTAVLQGFSAAANFDTVRFNHVMMPGATSGATSLAALNITNPSNYSNVTFTP
ncbi:glycosyl hydrolase family 28 protein [Streptomyces sp. SID13031]|uniref:glycosyl hydrolase family 28 protein n=1 Tax=Streptomyces sp. SID13031 TaxID=2706046 RepID=UPI0013C74C96|nr:glycosyl hydrolase family 28 protein [Streptomyces sp. SID13031]NEA34743.1 coagulation factor 5/8 type domain-containing protein [Streptomyces sp. SID13031]